MNSNEELERRKRNGTPSSFRELGRSGIENVSTKKIDMMPNKEQITKIPPPNESPQSGIPSEWYTTRTAPPLQGNMKNWGDPEVVSKAAVDSDAIQRPDRDESGRFTGLSSLQPGQERIAMPVNQQPSSATPEGQPKYFAAYQGVSNPNQISTPTMDFPPSSNPLGVSSESGTAGTSAAGGFKAPTMSPQDEKGTPATVDGGVMPLVAQTNKLNAANQNKSSTYVQG